MACRVILLRSVTSDPSDDPYHQEFLANGYTPTSVPALAFQFTKQKELCEILKQPHEHGGLILTSQRAVDALQKVILEFLSETMWTEHLQTKWQELPVFVVGRATAKAAKEKLGLTGSGQEAGSVESLVPHILEAVKPGVKPLLFPCGNLRRETIPEEMAKAGIELAALHVYSTCPDPNLRQSLSQLLKEHQAGPPPFVVFFSPSGVNFTAEVLAGMEEQWRDVKLVAIGNTTAKGITQRGWCAAVVAEQPNPQSLVQSVLAYSRGVWDGMESK